jgi:hypothetical protein
MTEIVLKVALNIINPSPQERDEMLRFRSHFLLDYGWLWLCFVGLMYDI